MVYFNYATYTEENEKKLRFSPRTFDYFFNKGEILIDEECEKLLSADPYFSVNKLYKKDFLIENNIFFGEGYFYEDFEFYVHAAQHASMIKLLPNVLYYVRVHNNSTTKSYNSSTIHLDSYLKAIEASYKNFKPRDELSKYHVLKYFVNRLLLYVEKRMDTDLKTKRSYRDKGFEILYKNNQDIVYPKRYVSNLYYMIFGMKLFQNKHISMIEKIFKVYLYNPKLLQKVKITRHANQALIGNRINRFIYRPRLAVNLENFRYKFTHPEKKIQISTPPTKSNVKPLKQQVLMLGFDYRYVGNSKYLFDYLQQSYSANNLKYATEDLSVSEEYRIEPRSEEFFDFLSESKVIIAESWIPLSFEFSDDQKIIQLWHGTPLKKVLYDSPEREVIRSNRLHKRNKKYDINRWDVLISDSKIATDKFLSAYSIEKDLIKETGYPRNNWLINHKNNKDIKISLKQKLGIPDEKLVITYLPTWRDYNFRSATQNNGYLLDKRRFIENLDPSFNFIFLEKAHDLSSNIPDDDQHTIYIPSNEDIQQYLLISDIVISDYSSVIFDCLYINLPFFLLYKDYDFYKDVRGTYEDMNEVLSPCIAYSEKELAEKIPSYSSILSQMNLENYTSKNTPTSFKSIETLIGEYLKQ